MTVTVLVLRTKPRTSVSPCTLGSRSVALACVPSLACSLPVLAPRSLCSLARACADIPHALLSIRPCLTSRRLVALLRRRVRLRTACDRCRLENGQPCTTSWIYRQSVNRWAPQLDQTIAPTPVRHRAQICSRMPSWTGCKPARLSA